MRTVLDFFEMVFSGLCAVLIIPFLVVVFAGYFLWLAFWPEPKTKQVAPFDGYEGWHV